MIPVSDPYELLPVVILICPRNRHYLVQRDNRSVALTVKTKELDAELSCEFLF